MNGFALGESARRALAALCFLLIAAVTAAEIKELVILHTNDLHANLMIRRDGRGGAANIAAVFRKTKTEHPNVLLIDAGDMTQGTPVSTIFRGTPIFEALNVMGYQVAVLGNHEFDYGVPIIAEYRRIADFPILSANAKLKGQLIADAPTALIDINGIRVGVIGLTTSHAVHQPGVAMDDPAGTIRRLAPTLEDDAHLVIALTHQGYAEDQALAREIQGVDLIIGGHSHTPVEKPEAVNGVIVAQAGSYGRWVGELTLSVDLDKKAIADWKGRLIEIPVEGLSPDPATQAVVDKWESKVSDIVDVKIGYNERRLSREKVKAAIEGVWLAKYGTDFALQNLGGTRQPLEAGDIEIRDIFNIMPFENTITILKLTRPQAAEEIDGARFVEDKPLYSLVTNSYVGDRLIEKYNIPEERIERITTSWRQPVIDFIRAHGHLAPPELIRAPAGTAR